MPHLQTHPVHADPRNIQAVTLHPSQYVSVQIIAKCREGMFRNIYDQVSAVINNELSSAPSHSAGAQNQMQSQVVRTSKRDGARGHAHGQQPQPAQTVLHTNVQSPLKHGSPPHGNQRSSAPRVGEALKWRDRSHTIGRHAQWTKQYNGVRYLLQYARWQFVHPQLTPISEWEERINADPDLHEALQKLQLATTSLSNYSHTLLACHDCPIIRHTSTPSFQCVPPRHYATAGSNCNTSFTISSLSYLRMAATPTMGKNPMHFQKMQIISSRTSISIRLKNAIPHHPKSVRKACANRSITASLLVACRENES